MSLKRLVIICTLPTFLAGCSEFYGSQPPAPVYGGQAKGQRPATSAQKKAKSHNGSKEIVKTQPLKDFSTIQSEPLPPAELTPLQSSPPATAPLVMMAPSPPPPAAVASEARQPPPPPPAISGIQEPSSPPPAPELTPFEPIESTVRLSPAVDALVTASNQNSEAGDLDSAAASIERAIRIEPRNATLFYKLALLRLKQAKPRLAEDLAKKSALLAANDNTLKKHCWLLIAHAREIQRDFSGAKLARSKAESF